MGVEPHLLKAPPVVWVETDNYVDLGLVTAKFEIHFRSPCGLLLELPVPGQPHVMRLQPPIPQVPAAQTPVQQVIQKEETDAEHEGNRIKRAISDISPNTIAFDRCETLYTREFLDVVNNARFTNMTSVRPPRFVTAMVFGYFVSDIYNTWKSSISNTLETKDLHQRVQFLTLELQQLQRQSNLTTMTERAISDTLKSQALILREHGQVLSEIIANAPTVALFTTYAVSKIILKASILKRFLESVKMNRNDMVALEQLLEHDELSRYENIKIKEVTSPSPGVLQITIAARIRDIHSKTYKLDAFEICSNLTGVPALLEYTGPRYLVHNATAKCVVGIAEPQRRAVHQMCRVTDFKDTTLRQWSVKRQSSDWAREMLRSSLKSDSPYNILYCLGQNVTIHNQTHRCPHYPVAIRTNLAFKTSDNISSPEYVEIIEDVDPAHSIWPHSILVHTPPT